jgi:crossover junction endodeoxyribonuclease RusA
MPDRFRLVYRLTVPPSGNRQARTGRGRHYTPRKIKDFREAVAIDVLRANMGWRTVIQEPVGVSVTLPKLRGDIDNRVKTLFDAITKAGVWKDDKLVKAFDVSISPGMPKDRCVVVIADLATYQSAKESA